MAKYHYAGSSSRVILKDSTTWDSWLANIESIALSYEVWDLCNPELDVAPEPLEKPTKPEIEAIKAKYEADRFAVYQASYLRWRSENTKYTKKKQGLYRVVTAIRNSVHANYQPVIIDYKTPYALLRNLRQRFAPECDPTNAARLRQLWRNLDRGLERNTDIDKWLLNWETVQARCKRAKMPGADDAPTQFLDAISVMSPGFHETWTLILQDKNDITFTELLNRYRAHWKITYGKPAAANQGGISKAAFSKWQGHKEAKPAEAKPSQGKPSKAKPAEEFPTSVIHTHTIQNRQASVKMTHSILSDLPVLPLAESFALTEAYNLDTFPEKVNLGQGVYRDEECQPWILPSVRSAEEFLHRQHLNHEYLPIQGAAQFTKEARNLIFSPQLAQTENITSVQTIAGTGANHLAALFCARYLRPKNVFISDPTWDNHHLIWETAGPDIKRKLYPYYDPLTRSLDFDGMIAELENSAEENDVVILHACAHNPTGIDPTHTQWEKIAEIVAKKRLFVVFDSAYQGFASGDLDADAWAIRYFYSTLFGDASLPTSATPAGMIVCQSFSKNFGLYGERIGALHLVTPPSVSPQGAYTHLVRLIRAEISCPSLFGERCVHTILTDLELRSKWEDDVKTMASRIQGVRMSLKSELENIGAQGNWDHIGRQIGMFSYTGLSKTQVHRLKEVHHVYMLDNGRMSLSGLNGKNVAYVARAIKEVADRD